MLWTRLAHSLFPSFAAGLKRVKYLCLVAAGRPRGLSLHYIFDRLDCNRPGIANRKLNNARLDLVGNLLAHSCFGAVWVQECGLFE
jgi:hypothetical protein